MKRVFVSQPTAGKTDIEIVKQRRLVKELAEEKWGVVDMIYSSYGDSSYASSIWYLSQGLKSMASADVVVACQGYSTSPGCLMEAVVANEYGVPLYMEVDGRLIPFGIERRA